MKQLIAVTFGGKSIKTNLLAKFMGLEMYDDEEKPERFPNLMRLIFTLLLVNMVYVLISEFLFILMSILHGENFREATMGITYLGFAIVSAIKILSVLQKKPLLTVLIRNLRQIFPADLEVQKKFDTRRYMIRFNLISFSFVAVNEILIWWYSLYPGINCIIRENVPRSMPFHVWIPWRWQDHWSYYILYVSQVFAGYTSMSGQLASDLLLISVAAQVTMHYRYLADRILTYQPRESYEDDRRFLKDCIEYHQKALSASTYMNEVFGVSLLVNFISTTFITCFLSFQMTIGVDTEMLFMLFIFLFCSLFQIYIISSYGEELIMRSESVGHAVYNHNWINTDVRYRKMLILIIERSQKPATLKATRFLIVSMETMANMMQLSYKFYALTRSMYLK